MDQDPDRFAKIARAAWVEYISANATNPPVKWLTPFDELSEFWKGLNRNIANKLAEAIVEESSARHPEEVQA